MSLKTDLHSYNETQYGKLVLTFDRNVRGHTRGVANWLFVRRLETGINGVGITNG